MPVQCGVYEGALGRRCGRTGFADQCAVFDTFITEINVVSY
jgi:hypothetical protein